PSHRVTESPSHRVTESPNLPFTGRSAELDRLRIAADAGRLAFIEGEPGIGKTRLAEEFLSRRGGLVLVGEARELEQSLPYQPVVTALRGLVARSDWPSLRGRLALDPLWLREVARLLPELLSVPDRLPPADESRLWEALARLLVALARVEPLALLIDDLQWADATTLGLLGYLLRRVVGTPMVILATARPSDLRSPLGGLISALLREGRVEQLSLSRLAPDDTLALARSLSPIYAQPLASWLDRSAEGNPYIISELVSYARSSGLLVGGGTLNLSALSADPVVPQTVYSLIQGRLIRLSEGARRVLDAAVAVGREFEFDVAARAAALSEGAALDALDELRTARLVRPLDDGRFAFDHSLTMEVAYREVSEPRHRLLHRRVGEALESLHRDRLDASAGLIASHFAEGGAPERAATYAVRAGRRAALVAAWAEAAAFYEQALTGTPDAGRPALLLALGEALHNAGEIARAAERLREALDTARVPADAHAARLALARTILSQGRYAEMIDLVRPLHGSPVPSEAVAALFLWGTALSLEGADLAGAAERLRAAESLIAEQPAGGDLTALAQVRFELGSVMAQQGDLVRAIACYHEAMVVADGDSAAGTSTTPWRVLARNNLAYHVLLLGDLDLAERHIADATAIAEERGAISLQPYLFSTAGEIALARGDLAEAERLFGLGMAIAERLHIPERIAGLGANLGLVALRRGEYPLAIHHLSTALTRADSLGTRHLAAQIRVWLAPLLPPADAHAALAEARAIAESGGRTRILEQIERLERL
ncbi:MAG: AAA family ATPase, partial [Chloroflexales bacterium]